MRFSELFTKTSKTAPADADSVNAQLLTRAGFVSKQMAGVYNFLPLGLRVLTKIEQIIREEMNAIGANEVLLPALTLLDEYRKTDRQEMDVLFHLKGNGDTELVLNPTHEEVITPLVQAFALSYKDFPVAAYQIQTKFRNEARAKSGLLRGREFRMKDMYSFHTTQEDFDEFYQRARGAYHKIYERLRIGERTVYTYASGGSFSQYSHEFQTFADVGEDTVHYCDKCNIGVNKEVIEDLKGECPECGNASLEERKAVEVGNIFPLGKRFSDAFGFTCAGEDDLPLPILMGCYGIGPSRIMGVLAEIFHDERGLRWPGSVAPFAYHLVVLGNEPEVREKAEEAYKQLKIQNAKFKIDQSPLTLLQEGGRPTEEVLFDDRDASAGEKLADADLIGIPNRIVMSKKSLAAGGVEWKKRGEKEGRVVGIDQVIQTAPW